MHDNWWQKRRSIYTLGNKVAVSKDNIVELVENAVKHCPTAFNSQSGRVVVLFDLAYQKLWDLVEENLRFKVPEDKFGKTQEKLNTFRSGLGTILFFEDETVVQSLQQQFPLYKDNFPVWSMHASGMLQYIVWTMFAENAIGASLQHYNPLIDADVQKEWGIPKTWKLVAQMPFGSIKASADEKTFEPLDKRVRVFY